jgi:hypothetical protein
MMAEQQVIERHRLLHGIFDQCLAHYLATAPPPTGKSRTSIYDSLGDFIQHGRLLEHAVDELLQAFFRDGYSVEYRILDLMLWSHRKTLA